MSRPIEEKLWETRIRHNFYTNFLQDPDLHILLYISEAETNNIIREALRDYMAKHNCKAADPEFQARVFLAASSKVAAGHRPVGSEIMAELGEERVGSASPAAAKVTSPRKRATRNTAPIPAPVLTERSTQPVATSLPAPAPAAEATPVASSPMVQAAVPAPSAADEPPAPRKPPPVLDLGPEIAMADDAPGVQAAPVSQRDKWLARHRR